MSEVNNTIREETDWSCPVCNKSTSSKGVIFSGSRAVALHVAGKIKTGDSLHRSWAISKVGNVIIDQRKTTTINALADQLEWHVSQEIKKRHGKDEQNTKHSAETRESSIPPLEVPSEKEILDICAHGEDQLHEFKAPDVETDKISKEIAGFSNTKQGGLIMYGVDDNGSVLGIDKRRQDFDQSLQNSIRNTITPQLNVQISDRDVLGCKILLVVVPPWDRKNIYQYKKDMRIYIRKGTNIFPATAEELKKLGAGEYVV